MYVEHSRENTTDGSPRHGLPTQILKSVAWPMFYYGSTPTFRVAACFREKIKGKQFGCAN